MKPVITIKRGSTPSTNQKPSPQINVTRKIVDANHSSQIKKVSQISRTNTNDDTTKQSTKPIVQQYEKQQYGNYPTTNSGGIFESYQSKMQQMMNPNNQQFTQNSPVFLTKQPSNQANYQPFGVSEQDKIAMGNYGFPQAQFSKKQELRREDVVNSDFYKDLMNKYESLADKYQELKNVNMELQEAVKGRDEQIKKCRTDNQKYLQESIIQKRKNQELTKQNKLLKEQLSQQENEERKDNHEQLLEMMYAIRLHQQEEQMLQMAIQQSATEVQNDPNFVNVDNMTYEEMLELEEKNGKVSRGLPDEVIEKIPVIQFNSRFKTISEKCTICISEFEYGEKLKQLGCKHIYHPECIDSWLKQEKKCPVCKGEICTNC